MRNDRRMFVIVCGCALTIFEFAKSISELVLASGPITAATKLACYIYGQSILLPPIPIRMLKSHPVSHVNSHQISDWRAHVEASSSIPPPPVSPPKPVVDSAIYSIHEDKYNRLLHVRTDIPKSISKTINQHLQRTIDQHDTSLLLAQLPHPKVNPLVRSTPLAAVIYVYVQVSFQ